MDRDGSKKMGNQMTVLDGGRAHERRTHAEMELERALRALFYAMEGKSRNLHNVACGATHPARMLVRRLRDAKAARRDRTNYPLAKQAVREIDRYVDRLYGKERSTSHDSGEYPSAA